MYLAEPEGAVGSGWGWPSSWAGSRAQGWPRCCWAEHRPTRSRVTPVTQEVQECGTGQGGPRSGRLWAGHQQRVLAGRWTF